MKKIKLSLYLFSSIFINVYCFGQELPPIVKYNPSTYNAGNQNWMISQDKNHFMYFANNEGLLEFNGSNWNLYKSPNETIIRSVKVIDNRVYTGCYMEFGYWVKKNNGKLYYTSLSSKIKSKILEDEQFWNIINYDQWVVFQSLNRIYIYDSKTSSFKIISPKTNILKSFIASNSIFFQTADFSLFEIENGTSKLVATNSKLLNNKIVNIFPSDENLILHTQTNGFYKLVNGSVSKFNTEADAELSSSSVYSSYMLADENFAIGTISKGLYIITKEGKIKYNFNQSNGLCNNTVLSIFEDFNHNLWLGLDNGINCINLKAPIKSYIDQTGMLGTVYCSILFKNNLYVGTNQGLFYKEHQSNNKFKFIPGTKGQVWSLYSNGTNLFCGHDSGTFLINEENAELIYSQSGTWKFEEHPINKNIIIQGNYNGLSVLENTNNQWVFKNKIQGFKYSSRYFEITNSNEVYVSHEYKGIFRFQLDNSFTKSDKLYHYTNPPKGKNAGLSKYNNFIYYAYPQGICKLNSKTKIFEKDNSLSSVFDNNEYYSGKLTLDDFNKLWIFSKNYINYFTLNKINNTIKKNIIPIPATLTNSMLGFENITQLTKNDYLIGTTDGYYVFNSTDLKAKNLKISITDINANELNKDAKTFSLLDEVDLKYYQNNVTINYTVPEYNKYIITEYQYLLDGFQDNWSDWTSKSNISFKNLPSGDYAFKVRARISNSLSENVAVQNFTINKPWYFTNFALLIYCIGSIVLFNFINKQYKNYYNNQREKLIEENNRLLEIKELENEQQLMKVRNEQLIQDVDAKNKELAVSTMSLIKKDELLALIKEDLNKSSDEKSSSNLKSLVSTINRSFSKDDSWNVFKEAFDNADKDFLKKIKMAHPSLTPNDLRLCAYLRLNLTSKEIAPLLIISVRSVEIKRYRLRKKMELLHENGLVEYILSI